MVQLIITGFLGSTLYDIFTTAASAAPPPTTLKLDLLGSGPAGPSPQSWRGPGLELSTIAQSNSHK